MEKRREESARTPTSWVFVAETQQTTPSVAPASVPSRLRLESTEMQVHPTPSTYGLYRLPLYSTCIAANHRIESNTSYSFSFQLKQHSEGLIVRHINVQETKQLCLRSSPFKSFIQSSDKLNKDATWWLLLSRRSSSLLSNKRSVIHNLGLGRFLHCLIISGNYNRNRRPTISWVDLSDVHKLLSYFIVHTHTRA